MFQQSLGKVSRLSLKRKGPDGNGLKNFSNYPETVQIRLANLRELTPPETKIILICINWPTLLKLAFFFSLISSKKNAFLSIYRNGFHYNVKLI